VRRSLYERQILPCLPITLYPLQGYFSPISPPSSIPLAVPQYLNPSNVAGQQLSRGVVVHHNHVW
jgi:hypothetical protein